MEKNRVLNHSLSHSLTQSLSLFDATGTEAANACLKKRRFPISALPTSYLTDFCICIQRWRI